MWMSVLCVCGKVCCVSMDVDECVVLVCMWMSVLCECVCE